MTWSSESIVDSVESLEAALATKDFVLQVARGKIAGITHINKYGRNPDCDQAGSATAVNIGRSLWDGGVAGASNWVEPTEARIHQAASSSPNDDIDGGGTNAGAQVIEIFGLDSNYAFQDEALQLDGTTNVPTRFAYSMIYRVSVRSAGSTGYNEGAISLTADTDGTVTAQIAVGNNQCQMAIYQIPAGKTGYITNYSSSLHKSGGATKFADVFLMSKRFGEVWRVRGQTTIASDGNQTNQHMFNPYKTFRAKELIQVVANPSADGQDISAEFDLIIVDD